MSKMCQNCLHYYDDNLEECPYCNKKMIMINKMKK